MQKSGNYFRHNIFYIFFLIIFSAISFEGLLRWFGINKSWSEKVGHGYVSGYNLKRYSWLYTLPADSVFEVNNRDFKFTYRTNSLGIREKENPFTDTSAHRIICIGDSYTEGLGVSYENAYPRILEHKLNNRGFFNQTYNAGIAGSDPFYSFMLLKQKLIHFNPQYVLMTFNSSDLTDYTFRGGMERFKSDGTTQYKNGPWYETYYEKSYLFRFMLNNILQYKKELFIQKNNIPAKYNEAVKEYAQLFDSVNVFSGANGCRFLVIIQPIAKELAYKNKHNDEITVSFSEMEKELTQKKIMCINMQKIMTGKITAENIKMYSYLTDAHFNSLGYKMFAEGLLNAIDHQYPLFFKR